MLKTIKLYGILGEKFGKEFKMDVANTKEAMRMLCVQIAGFEKFMLNAHEHGLCFAVFLGNKSTSKRKGKKKTSYYDRQSKRSITGENIGEAELAMDSDVQIIKIVPRVIGAGGNGVLQTVLGAVMIAASFIPVVGQALAPALLGAGIGMLVGGVAQMLMPKTETQDSNQDGNKANFGFGGAVTTVAQGNPVPLLYGLREIGGALNSAGQYARDIVA